MLIIFFPLPSAFEQALLVDANNTAIDKGSWSMITTPSYVTQRFPAAVGFGDPSSCPAQQVAGKRLSRRTTYKVSYEVGPDWI